MAEPGVISEYVERLARELDFDPALSRRVQREVEDHLWEAAAADPTGDGREAERRAVARFGDPRAIAAQFAVVALAEQARRVSIGALLVIVVVFAAMKARLAWYAVTAWPTGQMGAVGNIVVSIDHFAFWLAIFAGMASWMYVKGRRIPAALTAEYRARLRRFVLLCLAATGALSASVISDGILTSVRLSGTPWSLDAVVPLVSMAIELVCAGGLVVSVRGMTQRTLSTGRAAPTE